MTVFLESFDFRKRLGYDDSTFGYGLDYNKDTDDLYEFDDQDVTKHEEYTPEAPGTEYEEFLGDVFDQQYGDEDEQKH